MVATAVSEDYVTLSWNEYTRPGYRFVGWNTSADGYGTAYSDGQTIKTPQYDMNLYAQWERTGYTIKFDANRNGGTGTGTMYDLIFNTETDTEALTKNTFTNEKNIAPNTVTFSFMGWNTDIPQRTQKPLHTIRQRKRRRRECQKRRKDNQKH